MDFDMRRTKLFDIDLDLIKQMKKFPLIYDTKHQNHNNEDIKSNIFRQLAKWLATKYGHWTNITPEGVQRKWNLIRDTFTRAHRASLNSSILTSFQSEIFQHASFLTLFITHRHKAESKVKPTNSSIVVKKECKDEQRTDKVVAIHCETVNYPLDEIKKKITFQNIVDEALEDFEYDAKDVQEDDKICTEMQPRVLEISCDKEFLQDYFGEQYNSTEAIKREVSVSVSHNSVAEETEIRGDDGFSDYVAQNLTNTSTDEGRSVSALKNESIIEEPEADYTPILTIPSDDTLRDYFSKKFSNTKAPLEKPVSVSQVKSMAEEMHKATDLLKKNEKLISRTKIICNVLKSLPPEKIGHAYLKIIELTK